MAKSEEPTREEWAEAVRILRARCEYWQATADLYFEGMKAICKDSSYSANRLSDAWRRRAQAIEKRRQAGRNGDLE